MKRYSTRLLAMTLMLFSLYDALAQAPWRYVPQRPVICYYNTENRPDHVAVSHAFKTLRNAAGGRRKSATIEVEYINFPADNQAKMAFQYAIDIWESELISSVPIRLRAEWANLEAGVLATAIWGSAYANFGGEQYMNTFYPVALAEKIAGHELNDSAEPDIVATFNRNIGWYLGTDGIAPPGRMDLVTIVLHEIAHGLGMTDSYTVNDTYGTVGLLSGGESVPFVFDAFVENGAASNLLYDFESPSTALAQALQGKDVFFNGGMTVAALSGTRPKLYAPTVFDRGSSISHLDEASFNAPGDANRLMTPRISPAESIHDPGSVLRGMFADMGWVNTRIVHEPLKDTERKDGQPYIVSALIRSDSGYDASTVKLHFSHDNINFTTVAMTPTGVTDEFSSSLPGTTENKAYVYYISLTDDTDRDFTSPGKMRERGKPVEQGKHFFKIGPDTEPPEISHEPLAYIFDTNSEFSVRAEVRDNQDVDEVILEYVVNGGSPHTHVMDRKPETDEYRATVALPPLRIGDIVEYRISASDHADQQNFSTLPEAGYFRVAVTGVMAVRDSYANDFNDEQLIDFYGETFSIITPEGFANSAIHSDHPYKNGASPSGMSDYTWQLQVPIRINEKNPYIRFDEVVLVEPGATNSKFGDSNFYDYVVVEGSADGGLSWYAFAPGYDSRDNDAWLSRYNSAMAEDNSEAAGDSTLYRPRKINMLESKQFKPGDVVLIRFRIFADQLAHGWGWAIDNLAIQTPVTDTEDPLEGPFAAYPTRIQKELYLKLQTNAASALVEIFDLQGRRIFAENFPGGPGHPIDEVIDMQPFKEGLYILRATTRENVYRAKIFRVR